MKKICAYISSNRKESSTLKYVNKVLSEIKKKVDVEVNIYTTESFPLEICTGCTNCFATHVCPLDKKDHMTELKENFLIADFIILGSPIYMHNVTSGMKNFIDRLAYWSHIFPLRGKNAMIISSADSNGGNVVINYLNKMLNFYGCPVVASANILAVQGYDDGQIEEHVKQIIKSLHQPVKSNEMIDKIFPFMQMSANAKENVVGNAEYLYWKDNNMLDAESFESLL